MQIRQKYKYNVCGYTRFMIIDQHGTHYYVNNSLFYWKWNAIEDYYDIKIGKYYAAKTFGYRVPMFGLFPNIYAMGNRSNQH